MTVDRTDALATLRETWFRRIEKLHQAPTGGATGSATGGAGLKCAERCTARCCPQAIASKEPEYAVGHVAILLPFEMEYILSKTSGSFGPLQRVPLELAPGISIEVGFVSSPTPCPFLTADLRCGIHDIRPLDCRSFPLIPVFGQDGGISFRLESECPSIEDFSADYRDRFKQVWEDLLPDLPMNYRRLYNDL